jgi:hypothetical protein
VPVPLWRYFAMTLPYRRGYGCIPIISEGAILEAEERGELADRLFVLWAAEQIARKLAQLLKSRSTRIQTH